MRLIILSKHFYEKYPHIDYPEILEKENRPYYCIELMIENRKYAIPIRHHIHHPFKFPTVDDAGLDYTKAIVIEHNEDISSDDPRISSEEWRILKRSEDKIIYEFKKYLRQYKRALRHPDNPRSKIFIQYSALQYFNIN